MKWKTALLFLLFAGLSLFLTFNRHSKSKYFNYHSEIWADKAGYYVYLPATFKYDFNAANFPDSMDIKTGNGFILNRENQKVLTKYTCGVALLQLPFYLLADAFAGVLNQENNGFSPVYHWSVNVAAVFYLVAGFYFLRKFLLLNYGRQTVFLVLLSLFTATNLYYYAIDETGMSHIYSFAMFSLFMWQLHKNILVPRVSSSILLGFIAGLILLLRPTNIIFLVAAFFLNDWNNIGFKAKMSYLTRPSVLIPVVISAFVVFIPQLLYWKYAYGSLFSYAYGNEGFNWANPQLPAILFSPRNGLLLYTPLYLLAITAAFLMAIKRIRNGIIVLAVFLVITYIFSSWWDWSFGCSLGGRSYVEYLALFSISLAWVYERIYSGGILPKVFFWLMLVVLIFYNLKITYSYDECFYGEGTWDWKAFSRQLSSGVK